MKREMFGRWEALTALAVLAFEPNLIAHGSLVTTDMALMATAFAAVYALYRFCRQPGVWRLAAAGLAVGLMLAAKHSAVIFVPTLFGLLLADALLYRRLETRPSKLILRRGIACAVIFLLGLTLLWASYGFRYRSIPAADAGTTSVADYIRSVGRPEAVNSRSAGLVTWVSRARLFPESYALGLADIVGTGSRNMYLFGRAYPTGQWFYFPVSFLVKSSAALLLLLPAGLLFLTFSEEKRRELIFLLAPALFFFAFALTSGINIGVRHVMPVYPFFIAAGAAGAVWLSRKFKYARHALVALLLFHAATAYRTAPDYVAFANDFWGGTDNTYRIFRDPNLDFGQNNKFVSEYLDIFVYRGRFEVPLVAALSHAERATHLVRLNRLEEAVADGLRAVELSPDDPRTHLALGSALARAGRKDEARREFVATIELGKSDPRFRNAELRAAQELERLK